ncbi:hypothetical protein Tco_1500710 [Tanacetum coccineum]
MWSFSCKRENSIDKENPGSKTLSSFLAGNDRKVSISGGSDRKLCLYFWKEIRLKDRSQKILQKKWSHNRIGEEENHTAITKLILRVKKLEQKVKTTKARRRARIVLSEDEEDEDAKIQEKNSADTEILLQEEESSTVQSRRLNAEEI